MEILIKTCLYLSLIIFSILLVNDRYLNNKIRPNQLYLTAIGIQAVFVVISLLTFYYNLLMREFWIWAIIYSLGFNIYILTRKDLRENNWFIFLLNVIMTVTSIIKLPNQFYKQYFEPTVSFFSLIFAVDMVATILFFVLSAYLLYLFLTSKERFLIFSKSASFILLGVWVIKMAIYSYYSMYSWGHYWFGDSTDIYNLIMLVSLVSNFSLNTVLTSQKVKLYFVVGGMLIFILCIFLLPIEIFFIDIDGRYHTYQ